MNYKRCLYFVEGPCEKKLVEALNKVQPYFLSPGKLFIINVIQEMIPEFYINMIKPGTIVVFVFDTDVEKTDILKKNIEHVSRYTSGVKRINAAQVLNFEDEIEKITDVKHAWDLTKNTSVRDFKNAVNRMKETEFRYALGRHKMDVCKLWATKPPTAFGFIKQDAEKIKIYTGKE